jgi:RimJ/RimL family protein N-acetyltransferase
MVKLVKQTDPDIIVTAKTVPEHNPSTRILDKNGFQFMGVVQDHEIGDAWSWQLK